MTPERREELVRRRERLKAQREHQSLERQRREFFAPLDEAGVIYSVVDDEPLVAWISSRFKVDQWYAIDWSDVEPSRCIASDVRASPALLIGLAAEERLGNPDVVVVYADAGKPSLGMRFSELLQHADIVLDYNWQTWAFDPASDWIIEFHHDLGWHWGRAA